MSETNLLQRRHFFLEDTSFCFCKSVKKPKGKLILSTEKSVATNWPRKDQSGMKEMLLRKACGLIKEEGEAKHLIRKFPCSFSNQQPDSQGQTMMSPLLTNFSLPPHKKRQRCLNHPPLETKEVHNPQLIF